MSQTRTDIHETVLVLDNGVEIHSSSADLMAGDFVRVMYQHKEIRYWDNAEWAESPVYVMGAILRCAATKGKGK